MSGRAMGWRLLVPAALLAACAAAPSTTASTTTSPTAHPTAGASAAQPTPGSVVRVAVSVATLWVSPQSPRRIDRPALQNPVHPNRWLKAMSTQDRRGLVGRVETQALYGEALRITAVSGGWLHVEALRQPTHRDSHGYPGWVPPGQVTTRSATSSEQVATVTALTTRLRPTGSGPGLTVSFGTRLPVRATSASRVVVGTLDGRRMSVAATDVAVTPAGDAALPATRAGVLATAMSFRGVPYLWGGRSGFAVDCSGFTNLVYGVHGIRIPRDADDQATKGTAVAAGHQRKADLAFFQRGSSIGHVGFVAGSGRLLHAPGSGDVVKLSPIADVSGLTGYRRYL